mmetsp:Transcript_1822/g.1844  ORF Transcript_1822/g.1844 Transcript_1822/m.1844 type:complete len:568 (-) Transcript_1822:179-1882(-)
MTSDSFQPNNQEGMDQGQGRGDFFRNGFKARENMITYPSNGYGNGHGNGYGNGYSNGYGNTQFYSSTVTWENRYGKRDFYKVKKVNEDNQLFLKEHHCSLQKNKDLKKLQQDEIFVYDHSFEKVERKSILQFTELPIDKLLLTNVLEMGFEKLTPIQRTVIPFITEGKDLMGCAQTGSGKTAAFLLPTLDKMLKKGPPQTTLPPRTSFPFVMILVPTRELVDQIFRVCRLLSKNSGISIVSLYGGVGHEDQVKELKSGADIIVTTPGRLLDFLESKLVDLSLVETFIIDEADRLLEMGFEKQLYEILNKLPSKYDRQTLLFSATFSKEIRITATNLLKEDYLLANSDITNYDVNKNIDQLFQFVEEEEKIQKLHSILQEATGSTIVFLERKKAVDELLQILTKAEYNCIAIHGDKTQFDRNNAIEKFKLGKVSILIGTDVIGRGIDFPNVSLIVNYDTPKNIDDYVHRIGRTGRCGNKGNSISFINNGNRAIINDLHQLLVRQSVQVPEFIREMFYEGKYNRSYNNGSQGNSYNYSNSNNYSYSNVQLKNTNPIFQATSSSKMSWRK